MNFLDEAVLFLGAAVIAVPLFSRLGLGSILGYLAAGILLGPHAFGLVSDPANVLHFAEFGVVLLLFLIGLELQPSRLWGLRRPVFGLGGAQVALTALVLTAIAWAFGLDLRTAAVTGVVLALSSTAIAVQLWSEKQQLHTRHGRVGFSILLFQDIAVIPLLAIIPLLTVSPDQMSLTADPWVFVLAAGAVAAVVLFGRYLVRPFLRQVVATGIHELFTIAALFVVAATAVLMHKVGLSMALGAFLAGVLLAESEYRHALVANIEPFKGLLLGLFFLAVGMTVDLGLVIGSPLTIAGLVVGLIVVKAAILYGLGRAARLGRPASLRLAASLAQGGEFAFVLFTAAAATGVLSGAFVGLMVVVVTLTMAATPLLHAGAELLLSRLVKAPVEPEYDEPDGGNRVIVAGFGRIGQIVGRVLHMRGIPFTALDNDFRRIAVIRRFGNKVYFGDPTRLWVLRAAGAEHADVLVLAVDDPEDSMAIVDLCQKHFPNLTICARARDRDHAYRLMDAGITQVVREMFPGSLEIAALTLQGLGHGVAESHDIVERFEEHDLALLREQVAIRNDEAKLIQATQAAAKQLEGLFERDQKRPAEDPDAPEQPGSLLRRRAARAEASRADG